MYDFLQSYSYGYLYANRAYLQNAMYLIATIQIAATFKSLKSEK